MPYHVLNSAEVLGTVVVPIVVSEIGSCIAIMVPHPQVNAIHNEDLAALEGNDKRDNWIREASAGHLLSGCHPRQCETRPCCENAACRQVHTIALQRVELLFQGTMSPSLPPLPSPALPCQRLFPAYGPTPPIHPSCRPLCSPEPRCC